MAWRLKLFWSYAFNSLLLGTAMFKEDCVNIEFQCVVMHRDAAQPWTYANFLNINRMEMIRAHFWNCDRTSPIMRASLESHGGIVFSEYFLLFFRRRSVVISVRSVTLFLFVRLLVCSFVCNSCSESLFSSANTSLLRAEWRRGRVRRGFVEYVK